MFENFKAYNDECVPVDDFGNATYLAMFNEKGYDDVINWAAENDGASEVRFVGYKKSHCYIYDTIEKIYCPLSEEEIPDDIVTEFLYYDKEKKNISNTSQKFGIKIQLVNGVTIEPNLYSDDFYKIADTIRELSNERLFAGQIKRIIIE